MSGDPIHSMSQARRLAIQDPLRLAEEWHRFRQALLDIRELAQSGCPHSCPCAGVAERALFPKDPPEAA